MEVPGQLSGICILTRILGSSSDLGLSKSTFTHQAILPALIHFSVLCNAQVI